MLVGGAKTVFVSGPAGPVSPLAVGTVSTGAAGSPASATITGTAPNQQLNLTIPKGDQGIVGPTPWQSLIAWYAGLVCVASAPATAVVFGGETYVCTASHIAGTFAADLTAGRWLKVAQAGPIGPSGPQGNVGQAGPAGPLPFSTTVPWAATSAYTAAAPASCVAYNGGLYVCTTGHTSGSTFDSSKWLLIGPASGGAAIPEGQCRLAYASGTALILKPYRGNQIFIGGTSYAIPSAGVTLANIGLAASTLYYVYAYISGGSIALEAVTTAHATDTTYGVEIKSGDGSRTLVGMIYTGAGTPGIFVDSATQRFVATWFNRYSRALNSSATQSQSTGSSTPQELNTAVRASFLSWGDGVLGSYSGQTSNSASWNNYTLLALDGTGIGAQNASYIGAPGNPAPCTAIGSATPAEGLHYLTGQGYTSGGTATWNGQVSGLAVL